MFFVVFMYIVIQDNIMAIVDSSKIVDLDY